MRTLPDCYKFVRAIAHRDPWGDEAVEIMLTLHENGKPVALCRPLEFEQVVEGARMNPTLRLYGHEAQELMDMLWNCGLRPTASRSSAGQMEAVEKHLADMRALAFDLSGIKQPG